MHKHRECLVNIVIERGNAVELFGIIEKSFDLLSQLVLLRIVMNRNAPIQIRLDASGVIGFLEYGFDCRPQSIADEQA